MLESFIRWVFNWLIAALDRIVNGPREKAEQQLEADLAAQKQRDEQLQQQIADANKATDALRQQQDLAKANEAAADKAIAADEAALKDPAVLDPNRNKLDDPI